MKKDLVTSEIIVKENKVGILRVGNVNYISLTDLAKYQNSSDPSFTVKNWLRRINTIDYIGLWEEIHNQDFNLVEFDQIKTEYGRNSFAMSPTQWVKRTKAIGLIMGCIFPYDEYDYLDYKCPKRGEITELIVTNKIRSKGIGQELINKMEEYFKSVGCEYVIVDVFAYNDIGKNFYNKKDYHARMETMIKKI